MNREPGRIQSTNLDARPPAARILIADDDRALRILNATFLQRNGYATATAEDGAAAWQILQVSGYDLLITDNDMPNISGLELVKKVRSARMPLPVILASGTLPTLEPELDRWLQPLATLSKPFSSTVLLETVSRLLILPPV